MAPRVCGQSATESQAAVQPWAVRQRPVPQLSPLPQAFSMFTHNLSVEPPARVQAYPEGQSLAALQVRVHAAVPSPEPRQSPCSQLSGVAMEHGVPVSSGWQTPLEQTCSCAHWALVVQLREQKRLPPTSVSHSVLTQSLDVLQRSR